MPHVSQPLPPLPLSRISSPVSPLPEKLTRESFWALAEVTRDAVHAGPLVLARVAEALVDVDLAQFS